MRPVLLLLLFALPAQANLQRQLGTDAGNQETFWHLLQNTVGLEASVGIFYASLSGGLTSLTALADGEGVSKAINAVGTGRGLVREVRFGLEVAGNEAYFSYLSDKLFGEAEQQVRDRVGNPLAEELILMLIGELRPDLGDLLGPEAKAWIKMEYGRFEGTIEESWRFAVREGQPWFGHRGAGWSSDYFAAEAGWFPEGRGKLDEFKKRRRDDTGDEGFGFFARYTSLGRPTVLGFGDDPGSGTGYILEDSQLTTLAIGVRVEILTCETFCWRISGTMVPFTGGASLDLGRFGTLYGALFGGGFEVKGSLPIDLFGVFSLSPYASFRADFLFPLLGSGEGGLLDVDINKVQFWAPDYLLWGPTAGITGKF